ncbi:MAG: efflux RND transporter periplasmic adaptor subunit [Epulopiscium sp.]|nr:efflux RND transporter periplasmic adaptor subunit [Candidatus Epulonipiscium sp.]
MNFRKIWTGIGILSLSAALAGCANGIEANSEAVEVVKPKPVMVKEVKVENYKNDISISGNVKPTKTIKVGFKVPGVINNVFIEEGAIVNEGQTLMTLDSYDYQLNVMAARSQYDALNKQFVSSIASAVNQAEANVNFIKTQYERVQRLYEKGAVAKKTVEELETTLIVAENKYQEAKDAYSISESQLQQAQAGIELAESKLADTTLKSPIKGTVVKQVFESGETISPGYPAVVLGQLDELEVEIGVADQLVSHLTIGEKVNVYVYGLEKEIEGTVHSIDTIADTSTRTFGVKILIDNEEMTIKPGMIAKVTITTGNMDTILVPVNSVLNDPDSTSIFVYQEEEGSVEKRTIEVGEVLGDQIQVLEGLNEGDKVVIDGQYKLKNGDKVKLGVEG